MRKNYQIYLILFAVISVFFFSADCFAETLAPEYIKIPYDSTISLEANIYRPDDSEQHPLVIFSHGRPGAANIKKVTPDEYLVPAQWFVDHGFVVVVPVRRGYGKSGGSDMETSSPYDPFRVGMAGTSDLKAVIAYMRNKSYVDPKRVVLSGISCGSLVSIAAASQNIEGVVGVLNFSGGLRYDPRNNDGAGVLFNDYKTFGKTSKVPTLWVYSAADRLFPAYYRDGMFKAFTEAGGRAKLVVISDGFGHSFITHSLATSYWEPSVIEFLTSLNVMSNQ